MGKTLIRLGLLLSLFIIQSSCSKKYSRELSEQFLEILDTQELQQAYDFYIKNQGQIDSDLRDEQGRSALHHLVIKADRCEKDLARSQEMVDAFQALDKARLNEITLRGIENQIKFFHSRMEGISTIIEFIMNSKKYLEPAAYLEYISTLIAPVGSSASTLYDGLSYQEQLQLLFYYFHPQRLDLLSEHLRVYDELSLCEELISRILLRGADREIKNDDGKTALALAKELNAPKTVSLLTASSDVLEKILARFHKRQSMIVFRSQDDETYQYPDRDYAIVLDYGIPQGRNLREKISLDLIRQGMFDEVVFSSPGGIPARHLNILVGEQCDMRLLQSVLRAVQDVGLPLSFKILNGPKYQGYIEVQSAGEEGDRLFTKDDLKPLLKKGLNIARLKKTLE